MMEKIIYKPKDLKQINNLIHDCWFDINRIIVDDTFKLYFTRYLRENKKELRKYLFFHQFEIPGVEGILEIHEVKSHKVNDSQNVQFYDLNVLIFDPEKNIIFIRTGIPSSIKIEVLSFKISVTISDKIVDIRKVWGFQQA